MILSPQSIEKLKGQLNQPKILVVGDVMLDRYWFGKVERISPEAPVPISKVVRTEDRPGGAANVSRNISSIGGDVTLLSVVGTDEAGETLKNLLEKEKVTTLFTQDKDMQTIVKLRVVAKNQQLIRIDFEETPSHEILAQIMGQYKELIKTHDLVILSDYGKGGLSHTRAMIKLANEHNKPVLIDPKGNDYLKYSGATIITPNVSELRDACGKWHNENELQTLVTKLRQELAFKYLLLTRSEDGMTLFNDAAPLNYPTFAKEVYDVSGAGDTVIASLALMFANGFTIQESVYIANVAAGIVVGKLGTATVSQNEILAAISP